MANTLRETRIQTNGINLNVIEAGPKKGPLVILLHGFPEFWFGWRKQIDHLASLGFHVLVPDQRGYNLSDKPRAVSAYTLDHLAKDVVGLIDSTGKSKATLVGHDWGGAVTWWTANKYPERLEKMVVLNVPHHAVLNRNLRRNFAQLKKSWYMFFFQMPMLPELGFKIANFALGINALKNTSRPGTFTEEDLQKYREAWSQPEALRSMINWYRAILRNPPVKLKSARIKVPTLLIWGARDKFLGREMAQPSVDYCDNGRLELLEKASHWVQHEEPESVNRLLTEFLKDRVSKPRALSPDLV